MVTDTFVVSGGFSEGSIDLASAFSGSLSIERIFRPLDVLVAERREVRAAQSGCGDLPNRAGDRFEGRPVVHRAFQNDHALSLRGDSLTSEHLRVVRLLAVGADDHVDSIDFEHRRPFEGDLQSGRHRPLVAVGAVGEGSDVPVDGYRIAVVFDVTAQFDGERLANAGLDRRTYAVFAGIRSGVVEIPLAVFGAYAVGTVSTLLPYAMGFAAGAMLFVISDEILPETHTRGNERVATLGTLLGVIVMLYLDVSLG